MNKYKLHREKDGELWIGLPKNGGDIGDLLETVLVLNEQLDEIEELKREIILLKCEMGEDIL
jgi:hypothetical protein